MAVTQHAHGIAAVDTLYVRPQMDASHLIIESGRAAFVDAGTNDSVPYLLDALAAAGLSPADVDYLFLTHIHLDHAGGAGLLMSKLPDARCVVHPAGAPHMRNPEKLVQGTIAVYGEALAKEMYGDILPIPDERVVEARDGESVSLAGRAIALFFTEGHARHHYCLYDETSRGVFTGDSFGLSYRELDTARGAFIFPTTTPTHFDPDEAHKSVDRILSYDPEVAFLTHYSAVTDLERLGNDMHRHLDAYVELAKASGDEDGRVERLTATLGRYLYDEVRAHGVTLPDEKVEELTRIDAQLNAQGLDIWLKRLAKRKAS